MRGITSSLTESIREKIGIDVRHFVKNASWVGIGQFVQGLTSLSVIMTFTRLASKEVYGEYQLVLALLSMVSILSLPGRNTAVVQAVAKGYEGSYRKIVKISFLWSLLGTPLLAAIGLYYCVKGNDRLGLAVMMGGVFFPFLYAPNSWRSFFQGKERFDLSTKYEIVQSMGIGITLLGVLFLCHGDLFMIVFAYLVSSSFFGLMWFFRSLKYVSNQREDSDAVSYGFFLTKINVLAGTTGRLDSLLIGTLLGAEQLAIYAVGTKFAAYFYNLLRDLLMVATPRIARRNTLDRKKYLSVFLLSFAAGSILIAISPWAIPFLFTEGYRHSVVLSQIVLAFLPFFVINNIYEKHFKYYVKNKKVIFWQYLLSPLFRIGLMLIGISFWGITGMAWVHGARSVVYIAIMFVLSKILQPEGKTS